MKSKAAFVLALYLLGSGMALRQADGQNPAAGQNQGGAQNQTFTAAGTRT